jgi:hypothetical protein
MTLWILFCRVTERMDTLFAFYAKNQEQAEQKAQEILREHHYKRIDLKVFPHGFVIHRSCLAGTVEEEKLY